MRRGRQNGSPPASVTVRSSRNAGPAVRMLHPGLCRSASNVPRSKHPIRDDLGPVAATRIALTDFRSYASALIEPGPGFVLLFGENGAGNTNVLEAVSLLA